MQDCSFGASFNGDRVNLGPVYSGTASLRKGLLPVYIIGISRSNTLLSRKSGVGNFPMKKSRRVNTVQLQGLKVWRRSFFIDFESTYLLLGGSQSHGGLIQGSSFTKQRVDIMPASLFE